MKVSVLQEQLKAALAIVSKALDSRPTLPVLANVLLRTEGATLQIVASNLEQVYTVNIGAKTDREGAITLPAKTLREFVDSLPAERIDLTLDEATQTVALKCGQTRSSIKGIVSTEFPPPPEPTEWGFSLPGGLLKRMINGVAFGAAKEINRPILTGILVTLENGCLELVTADGYRLAIMRQAVESAGKFSSVIPASALAELARVIDEDKDEVQIALTDSRAFFMVGRVMISVLLLEGKFPDFASIVPTGYSSRVVAYTNDLLRSCKRAEIFARDSNNSARMCIKPALSDKEPGEVMMRGVSAERGDLESFMDAQVEGGELEIAFNVRYIVDALNALSTEQVIFESYGAGHPGVFLPTDASATYVIMPMEVNR